MPDTLKALGIDRMNADERIALALEIWASLGDERPRGDLDATQQAELLRRDAELDASPGMALTWEQIRAHVEGKR